VRGFARVSVAVPVCAVGGFRTNVDETLKLWKQAHDERSHVVVFPELGLSTYTARDLFFDRTLLDSALASLERVCVETRALEPLGFVGMPLESARGVYNCAVAVQRGKVLGVVPKSYLPTYREFEERRWFRPGTEVAPESTLHLFGADVPFGTDLLFQAEPLRALVVGAEICEDIWVQVPPSMKQVGAGATVCCNLSASNFTIGKADLRRLLARSASDRGKCAYLYVAAGPGESSTDLAFDADAFVCENGNLLVENKRFSRQSQITTVDVDLEQLLHERRATNTFGDNAGDNTFTARRISFHASEPKGLMREITAHPFLPRDPETLARRLWEIFEIQTNALATRMSALGKPKLVLGVSGGLDSTQAALVCAQALDMVGQKRSDLVCVTMPGFGTSDATKSNAVALAQSLGAELRTISIAETAHLVLQAIGHPAARGSVDEMLSAVRADPRLGDTTLENVQARMRTLVLMTIANQIGGIVVGTGDLSEKALGWATYSGDHISMYDVNAAVPKTLIQFVVRWVANERATTWGDAEKLRATLFSILETPISPELLPLDVDGKIAHLTETAIGPYELHDFYLFHFVRQGRSPGRILDLALHAFGSRYSIDQQKKWLALFLQRFFTNQFKRSCTADGPKVGTVALSPRGDWRMPSDMSPKEWIAQVSAWVPEA
jgi:NAD+ synthase (glutamine-hydrolysing)